MMKKIIISLICCVVVFSFNLQAFAFNFPNGFWGINSKYEESLTNNDLDGIIKYGKQIITLMENEPDSNEKRDILMFLYI